MPCKHLVCHKSPFLAAALARLVSGMATGTRGECKKGKKPLNASRRRYIALAKSRRDSEDMFYSRPDEFPKAPRTVDPSKGWEETSNDQTSTDFCAFAP